jgi:hypothetical protein
MCEAAPAALATERPVPGGVERRRAPNTVGQRRRARSLGIRTSAPPPSSRTAARTTNQPPLKPVKASGAVPADVVVVVATAMAVVVVVMAGVVSVVDGAVVVVVVLLVVLLVLVELVLLVELVVLLVDDVVLVPHANQWLIVAGLPLLPAIGECRFFHGNAPSAPGRYTLNPSLPFTTMPVTVVSPGTPATVT